MTHSLIVLKVELLAKYEKLVVFKDSLPISLIIIREYFSLWVFSLVITKETRSSKDDIIVSML